MSTTKKCLVAASFIVSLGAASSAVAGDIIVNPEGQRTIEVAYADLNLDHADGQRALEGRIDRAAKRVCGYSRGRVSLSEARTVASCIDGATAKAMLALNNQRKTQLAARTDTGGPNR